MVKGAMRADLYPELYQAEERHWWHRQKRRLIHALIARYCHGRGKILDVGCGSGKILAELEALGLQAYGVDTILTQAKRRGLNLKKTNLQTDPLPFSNNFFDAVICLDTLEHIDNDRRLVREMARVAKPGGVIIISVPAYSWLFSYWDKMLGHFRRYNRRTLLKAISQKTLTPVLISYFFSFLLLPAIFVRLLKKLFRKKQRSDFTADPLRVYTHAAVSLLGGLELLWLKKFTIPFGLSLFGVFIKK